jgi:hypothetical protein
MRGLATVLLAAAVAFTAAMIAKRDDGGNGARPTAPAA